MEDRRWQLLESSGTEGLYDKEIASGVIDDEGRLVGLPQATLTDAKGVWSTMHESVQINGSVPPRSY